MKPRLLGGTGLEVTQIGLGLAAVGRPAYLTAGRKEDLGADRSLDAMERRSHELLDAAYDAGVRYFDVAHSYGHAEAFLASWLRRRSDAVVTVGSKWGYTYTGDWRIDADVHEVKDHSFAAFLRQSAESQEILGDRIDLYQIHSATLESGVLEDREVLAGMAAMGPVAGLTVSGSRQAETLRRALEVDVDGVNPFRVVQATWNILEPSAGGALQDAHAAGWGVIVKEAVANGRLTDHGTGRALTALKAVAERLEVSIDRAAIAAVLAQPWCDVVLSGAATVPQLKSNLAAKAVVLSDEDRAALAGLAESPEAYWSLRSSLPWT
jgi:aryl-alcohol dehydrogenase-like predicted oxidoreductase